MMEISNRTGDRMDHSFPQIAQMIERIAGLPFGVIESLPSGGRERLVF